MPSGATLLVIYPQDTPNTGRYKINYNFSILAFSSFTGISASKFTNPNPTTQTVGGIQAGSTFAGDYYLQDMMDLLLYPASTPAFTSFLISAQATSLEVGETVAGLKTFTWSMSAGDLQPNTIDIEDTTNSTILATNLADDGSETIFLSSVSRTTPGANVWTISAQDTDLVTFSREYQVNWYYAAFYGIDASTTLNAAGIVALTGTSLVSDIDGTYPLAGPGYGYICVPDTFSTPNGFRDSTTNLPIEMAGTTEGYNFFDGAFYHDSVSVTRNSIAITYRVYRTRNTISTTTIAVSLTGGTLATLQSVINAGNIANGNAAIIGNFSATTFYSGSTPLNTILGNYLSGLTTYVQPGSNITTGGTALNPIVSVVGSPTFTSVTSNTVFATNLSGGTLFSGNTNIGVLFGNLFAPISVTNTYVQEGWNIVTGGTPTRPIVSVYAYPQFSSVTTTSMSAYTVFSNTISGNTFYSGNTPLNTILSQFGSINTTYVQPGSNIATGGTPTSPTVGVIGEPVFTGVTSGWINALNELSGFTIYSAGTNLSHVLEGITTFVQSGLNITTGGTKYRPIINIAGSPIFTGITSSSISGASISATTFFSGNTNLSHLLGQSAYVQPGLNITTGGTSNLPIVNLAGSISLTGITASSISATTLSATTFYSGSTPLNTILSSLGAGSTTYVQAGLNITTGGTVNAPIVNVAGSPVFTAVTSSFISGASISATTFYSGGTPLQNLFSLSAHTHVSSAITDGSYGGNGIPDFNKLFKFGQFGNGTFIGSGYTPAIFVSADTTSADVAAAISAVTNVGIAIKGFSSNGKGGYFESEDDIALYATSPNNSAVYGLSTTNYGGQFESQNGVGIYGLSTSSFGAVAQSLEGIAFLSQVSDTGYTQNIARFYNLSDEGLLIENNGGLKWTSLTGSATTIDNLGLKNVFVSPGVNVYTYATDFNTIVGVIGSPIFTGVTSQTLSATSLSATTFYSGNTSLNTILSTLVASGTATYVQPGLNITTGGTASAPIINVTGSPIFTSITVSLSLETPNLQLSNDILYPHKSVLFKIPTTDSISGSTDFTWANNTLGVIGSITATTININSVSATTFFSGNTDLSYLLGQGGATTYVQQGLNITTGGTPSSPIINVVGSPVFTAVTTSSLSGASISADTIRYTTSLIDASSTNFQDGVYYRNASSTFANSNRFTYDASLAQLMLSSTVTGAGVYAPSGGLTGNTVYGVASMQTASMSATTYYSGNTPLNTILSDLPTYVQSGLNITTGGTPSKPIINVAGSIALTAVTASSISGTSVSAATFYEGSTDISSRYAPKDLSITRNSGTYILALTDDSRTILLSSSTAQNCVVPRNDAVAFPIGSQVMVVQTGAGQVTFSADTGVTLLSYTSLTKLSGLYAGASLIKTDTNEWALVGNLST